MITAVAFVLLAGAGGLTRWATRSSTPSVAGSVLSTVLLNLAGAFAAGVLVSRAGTAVITAVGVGGLGSLTTFSTLVGDVVELTAGGRRVLAGATMVVTIAGGIALADLGLRLG